MIIRITRASAAAGMVDYLAGPGRENEHERQRVIWGSLGERGVLADDQFRLQIINDLELPGRAYPGRVPASGEFWHCSLTLAAREGAQDDVRWTAIGRDFMRGMDVPADARWVLVRHGLSPNGNDHVHIAASVVSESGQTWTSIDGRDWLRASRQANRLEHAYGLEVLAARESGTGERGLHQSEYRIAQAKGEVPARRQLEMAVRRASILSGDWDGFTAGLHQQGVNVDLRHNGHGYTVSLAGTGVWFPGSALAKDLSLPRLQASWDATGTTPQSPSVAVRQALGGLRKVQEQALSGGLSPVEVAGAAHEVGGVLAVAANRRGARPEVVKAARDCARYAGRRGPTPGAGRLRGAAMALAGMGSGSDRAVMERQLLVTFEAVQAAHRLVGSTSEGKVVRVSADRAWDGLVTPQQEAQARLNARAKAKRGRPWMAWGKRADDVQPRWDANTFRANLVADAIQRDHPDAYRQHGPVERITDAQSNRIVALSRELYRNEPRMVIYPDAIDRLDRGRATQLERQLENGLGRDRVAVVDRQITDTGRLADQLRADQTQGAADRRDGMPRVEPLSTRVDRIEADHRARQENSQHYAALTVEFEERTGRPLPQDIADRVAQGARYTVVEFGQGDEYRFGFQEDVSAEWEATEKWARDTGGEVYPPGPGHPAQETSLQQRRGDLDGLPDVEHGRAVRAAQEHMSAGPPEPETWALKPITPVQDRALRARGYGSEDLAGMPSKVASRHITHDLNIKDAQGARGTYPAIPDGTAQAPGRPVAAQDHAPPPTRTQAPKRVRVPARGRD